MTFDTYTDPVAKLLTYGDCRNMDLEEWTNYPEEMDLSEADIPELIRMATDPALNELDEDRPEVWAPIHAWRSLAQLQAEAAIAPLTQLFDMEETDWVPEEMPKVYAMLGPAAIPTLAEYLADNAHGTWARVTAADSLQEIARVHPESRDECVALLTNQLEQFESDQDATFAGMVICNLLDLKAVEAAGAIEKAYATGQIDEMIAGSLPAIQVELRLKQKSDFSPEELKPKMPDYLVETQRLLELLEAQTQAQQKPKGFAPAPKKPNPGKKKKKK